MTEREQQVGVCDQCSRTFHYYLINNGFNDSWYAYCDRCGTTAILSLHSPKVSKFWSGKTVQGRIPLEIEPYLRPCSCGGHFLVTGSPRCLRCTLALLAAEAASWIETQAPGAKKGWRWQKSWDGLYCMVIERRIVHDNFV
jgi:hypothetical protein